MVIQHNLTSMYGDMVLKNTNYKLQKTTSKMSSGYRINYASDDAAGLAISEKMRGQIRGLERADNNIEEGLAYVKTADGVLDEVTSIVQRMRELTVQALNDTNMEDDKQQIQQEIDQLKHEITRISGQTEYNTQKMFTKNEEVYSEFHGGKKWRADAAHKVVDPKNTLTIKLADTCEPSEVTVTVPEGNYTTYELVETIDELLEKKGPRGTYFMLEHEDGDEIKLMFQGGTELSGVYGGLSDLFFESFGGAGVGSLIGTTNFDDAFPLNIVSGKNDRLSFSVDKLDGSPLYTVAITLDAGKYTRAQTIDALNQKLLEAGHPEVQAVSYGTNNIELTAGTSLITGLKGNMFQIDSGNKPYDSVFYDNVKYGTVTNTASSIKGSAYYKSTEKVSITSVNNKLAMKGEKDSSYTEITIPEGEYTIGQLASELNTQLNSEFGGNSPWKFQKNSSYLSSSGGIVLDSGYYDYLVLQSVDSGIGTSIELDKNSSAYNTLFEDTNAKKLTLPNINSGIDPVLYGQKKLSSVPISLTSAGETICLDVDGTKDTLTLT